MALMTRTGPDGEQQMAMQVDRGHRAGDGVSARRGGDLARWRPFLAGLVLVLGGTVAGVMGAVQGTLLNVAGVLGATLFVAGVVDGAGRYRGAGVTLLLVFSSAKVISEAPKGFQRGVGYGLLMALYGVSVLVRRWPRAGQDANESGPGLPADADLSDESIR